MRRTCYTNNLQILILICIIEYKLLRHITYRFTKWLDVFVQKVDNRQISFDLRSHLTRYND